MRLIPAVLTVAAVIAADQLSKYAIASHFRYGEVMQITSFFNLVLVYNVGAAFNFLSDASGWQRPFFICITLAAIALIVWMIRKHRADKLFGWGLTLILAGAVGNLLDRIVRGHVIDFLDFHTPGWHFWAFNVADSSITIGAGLLILDSFRPRKS
jgi:signal peptidase II